MYITSAPSESGREILNIKGKKHAEGHVLLFIEV